MSLDELENEVRRLEEEYQRCLQIQKDNWKSEGVREYLDLKEKKKEVGLSREEKKWMKYLHRTARQKLSDDIGDTIDACQRMSAAQRALDRARGIAVDSPSASCSESECEENASDEPNSDSTCSSQDSEDDGVHELNFKPRASMSSSCGTNDVGCITQPQETNQNSVLNTCIENITSLSKLLVSGSDKPPSSSHGHVKGE